MRLAALLVPSVLVTAALAVVRQQHYTKLKMSGAPKYECVLNATDLMPPEVGTLPSRYLLSCGAWCDATPSCSAFCVSHGTKFCSLYSSMIGLQYNSSTSLLGLIGDCYSSSASFFNIIDKDTPITVSNRPILFGDDSSDMKDHVYHPCQNSLSQSYCSVSEVSPWVKFDFGKEETVAQIYVTADPFKQIVIRLGNSVVNSDNPIIHYVAESLESGQEYRVPLTQHHKGRYLSFNGGDGANKTYFCIGEVRVLKAFE